MSANTTAGTDETYLKPKHEQLLSSLYDDADWLCETLASNTYVEVPSRLESIRNGLRHVLIDCDVLENLFACEQCGWSEWQSKVAIAGRYDCPECGEIVQWVTTQHTSQ